jgi:hypothetical protein
MNEIPIRNRRRRFAARLVKDLRILGRQVIPGRFNAKGSLAVSSLIHFSPMEKAPSGH